MLRLRRSVRRRIGVTILSMIVGGGLLVMGVVFGSRRTEQAYEEVLKEKTVRMNNANQLVYITTSEVRAGEIFSEKNTEQRYLLTEQAEEGIAKEVLGMVACADLMPGVILNTALCGVSDLFETERECVFEDIAQVEKFPDYAVVDVRIRYPNGENYCVLGRKVLRREEEDANGCRLYLTEAEQLLISAARYDAEVYDGTTLYAVAFLEERLQEEADSRYIPSEQVILQLQQSAEEIGITENWYSLRRALEERLQKNKEQKESIF